MKKLSELETKKVKAGWTCWFPFCGAKGPTTSSGLLHAQLNPLHRPFMSL
ncbi:MAG: hypothetical protein LBV67_12155 [Streptococcaceae bacterium]|jgi:hypothetical protein|nr:hypothetical protein [Streptococcaceae bacterium]